MRRENDNINGDGLDRHDCDPLGDREYHDDYRDGVRLFQEVIVIESVNARAFCQKIAYDPFSRSRCRRFRCALLVGGAMEDNTSVN